jgi:hypothetical protein
MPWADTDELTVVSQRAWLDTGAFAFRLVRTVRTGLHVLRVTLKRGEGDDAYGLVEVWLPAAGWSEVVSLAENYLSCVDATPSLDGDDMALFLSRAAADATVLVTEALAVVG